MKTYICKIHKCFCCRAKETLWQFAPLYVPTTRCKWRIAVLGIPPSLAVEQSNARPGIFSLPQTAPSPTAAPAEVGQAMEMWRLQSTHITMSNVCLRIIMGGVIDIDTNGSVVVVLHSHGLDRFNWTPQNTNKRSLDVNFQKLTRNCIYALLLNPFHMSK